jgi:hypothetical protein
MRPSTIVNFEWLSLLAILLGVATMVLAWDSLISSVRSKVLGSGLEPAVAILAIIYVALLVLLILLTSRRASNVAKWLLVLIIAAGLVGSVPRIPAMLGAGVLGWVETAQMLIQLAAIVMLFLPASRAWFRNGGAPVG